MDISSADLHIDMIKPSKNCGLESVVDSVTNKSMISDTTLMSFIPPQVCKMTPWLLHICVCEILLITKDTRIYLNIFKTKVLTDLQHKYVGIHLQNSGYSTTSATHYKEKLFHMANV